MLDFFLRELEFARKRLARLERDAARVHPGSPAQARVLKELKVAEVTVGLWLGRIATEFGPEAIPHA